MKERRTGFVILAAYIATIFLANLTLARFGIVRLWPLPLMAPAGVLWAGCAFGLRDGVHDALGARWTVAAIIVGAALSALVAPQFALASGVAFLLSELADMAVYTPLRHRHWPVAVIVSNLAGDTVDSLLFLWLAFGSLAFWEGQIVGKWAMTAPVMLVMWLMRRREERQELAVAA